jgi:hypothetical protein
MKPSEVKSRVKALSIKFGILNKEIAAYCGVCPSCLSNAMTGRRKISTATKEKIEKGLRELEVISDKNQFQELFREKFGLSKLPPSILGLFKDGTYHCYEYGEPDISLSELQIDIKKGSIILVRNGLRYENSGVKSEVYSNSVNHQLEIRLLSKRGSLSLFMASLGCGDEFIIGLMVYSGDHFNMCSTKFILVHKDVAMDATKEGLIKHYFRSRYMNHLKLPSRFITNFEDLYDFFSKQEMKGWTSVDFSEKPGMEDKSTDLFISTQISSLEYEKFREVQRFTIKMIEFFKKNYTCERIYYRGATINSIAEFNHRMDDSRFHEEVTKALKSTRHFIFLALEENASDNPPSAMLFQLGWILSHSTKVRGYLFVKNMDMVPYLVRHQKLPNFKIVTSKSFDEVMQYFESHDMFSDEDMITDTYVY